MTRVTTVRLVRTRSTNGLLGFVSCSVAGLCLDGLTLRRTRQGRLAVSFPCRRDRSGRKHPIVRPRDGSLERAILAALRRQGALGREELRQLGPAATGGPGVQPAPDHHLEQARAQLGRGQFHRRQRTGKGPTR